MNNNQQAEKVLKGDAGNAATEAASKVAQEREEQAREQANASIIGTDQDQQGRFIPLGEPTDDVRIRELARYFDVSPSEFRDAGKDLAEILQFVSELTSQSAMSDLLLTISQMEDAIKPSHGLTPRYKHFFNYLQEKMIEYDVRKRVRAWET